jgi:hypothetical protein
MKFSVSNDEVEKIDAIREKLQNAMRRIGEMFE